MKVDTVNISFNKDLLSQIDRLAKEEARSRSELIREAARLYINRKKQWKNIFFFGKKQVKALSLQEADIPSAINTYRHKKSK